MVFLLGWTQVQNALAECTRDQHSNNIKTTKKKPVLLHFWGPNSAELMAETQGREQHQLISALASHRIKTRCGTGISMPNQWPGNANWEASCSLNSRQHNASTRWENK